MAWRLAHSLADLRAEVNARWPGRSRVSDGTIGDAAHSSRVSDHNPDAAGVVRAVDITNWDPQGVLDADLSDDVAQLVVEHILRTRDPRVKYLIWRGRMVSSYRSGLYEPWSWRPYTGPNGHFVHVHVSVLPGAAGDRGGAWGLDRTAASPIRTLPEDDVTPDDIKAIAAAVKGELLNFPTVVSGAHLHAVIANTEQLVAKAVSLLQAQATPEAIAEATKAAILNHPTAPSGSHLHAVVGNTEQLAAQAVALLSAQSGASAQAIADAIPDDIARQVADELARRLSQGG